MREDGAILVDGIQVVSTHMCCHCGQHFEMTPSRYMITPQKPVTRDFCMKCMSITCGDAKCKPCVPLEKQLEIMEGCQRGV